MPPGFGRWGWGGGEPEAHAERCPVCERIWDIFPAGRLVLRGPYFAANRKEILRAVIGRARAAAVEHPARAIDGMQAGAGGVVVSVNDARLARQIGDELEARFGGALEYHYEHHPNRLIVSWNR